MRSVGREVSYCNIGEESNNMGGASGDNGCRLPAKEGRYFIYILCTPE